MEIVCKCPSNCRCFNKAKIPFELKGRTVDDWLREFTADQDTIKVHVLKGGALALQNERTLVCYILKPKDKDA